MSHDDSFFRVTAPCPLALSELSGEGPRRYCAQCERHVHDLSALTRRQAVRLRRRHQRRGERLCGIIRQEPGGALVFRPGLRERLRQHLRALPALALLIQPGSGCPADDTPPAPPLPQPEPEVQLTADDTEGEDTEVPEMTDEEMRELLLTIGGYIE